MDFGVHLPFSGRLKMSGKSFEEKSLVCQGKCILSSAFERTLAINCALKIVTESLEAWSAGQHGQLSK